MSVRTITRAMMAAGILLMATSAWADYVYNYNSFLATGDYNTAANWSAGVVPVSSGGTDSVNMGIINGGFTATLVNDASTSVPDMLSVGYSANQQLTGSNGTLNVNDPSAYLSVGSTALAVLGSGGKSGPSGLFVGYDGTGAMSVSAGTVSVIGNLGLGHDSSQFVGCSPTGTMTQTGGYVTTNTALTSAVDGQYLAGDLNVGDGVAGSSGSYSISGGTLNVGRQANIGNGNGATGTFTQTGGSITLGALRMNNYATYTMSGNSAMSCGTTIAGANIIGGPREVTGSGSSTFNQTGGTVTFTNRIDVGYQSPGAYNINGATVNFGTALGARSMNVGNGLNGTGVGTVNISNGGQWVNTGTLGTLTIGAKSDGSGVTVTGSGSSLTVGGSVTLGALNWGYLNVADHAAATIGKFYLGGGRTGANTSTLNVNTGGTVSLATGNYIGYNGKGEATIDGGTLKVTGATTKTYIGHQTTNASAGTLTVKGTGVFSSVAGVDVGSNGSGVVNVQGNATFTSGAITVGVIGSGVFNQSGGTVNPGGNIGGPGAYHLTDGLLNMNGRNFSVSTFDFSDGIMANVANVTTGVILPVGGNASFDQNLTHSGTVSGRISGDGGLTKLGDGMLTINYSAGANSYAGLTTITAGLLDFVGPNAWTPVLNLGGAYLTGGQLVFDYTGYADPYATITSLIGTKLTGSRPLIAVNNTVSQQVTLSLSEVPEPSTLLLAAAGIVGLLAYAWRKRK